MRYREMKRKGWERGFNHTRQTITTTTCLHSSREVKGWRPWDEMTRGSCGC